jgi:hypothetical protein
MTNPANKMMAELHNGRKRIPAFLTTENYPHWLDQELPIHDRLALICPVPEIFFGRTGNREPLKNTHWIINLNPLYLLEPEENDFSPYYQPTAITERVRKFRMVGCGKEG